MFGTAEWLLIIEILLVWVVIIAVIFAVRGLIRRRRAKKD